jgi:hypothetical protein
VRLHSIIRRRPHVVRSFCIGAAGKGKNRIAAQLECYHKSRVDKLTKR